MKSLMQRVHSRVGVDGDISTCLVQALVGLDRVKGFDNVVVVKERMRTLTGFAKRMR